MGQWLNWYQVVNFQMGTTAILLLADLPLWTNLSPSPSLTHARTRMHTHTHTHTHTQLTATLLITLVADCRGKECLRDTENSFRISENIFYHIQSLRQHQTYTCLNRENSVEGYES